MLLNLTESIQIELILFYFSIQYFVNTRLEKQENLKKKKFINKI